MDSSVVRARVNESFPDLLIVAIIPYGSRLYKNKEPSDYDFMVLVETTRDIDTNNSKGETASPASLRSDPQTLIDVTVMLTFAFMRNLEANKPKELELLFTPFDVEHYYISDNLREIFRTLRVSVVDSQKMRHEYSAKTNNCWSRAGKKITMSEDYRPGFAAGQSPDYMLALKSL